MKRLLLLLLSASVGIVLISGPGFAATRSQAKTVKLTIVHVQTGCHTWSTGKMQPPQMSMTLRRGDRLSVGNVDVDAHKLVQTSGPKLRFAGMMMTGHGTAITFSKAGIYRFKTVVVEMPGMPEVKTSGPDHNLLLTVRVT